MSSRSFGSQVMNLSLGYTNDTRCRNSREISKRTPRKRFPGSKSSCEPTPMLIRGQKEWGYLGIVPQQSRITHLPLGLRKFSSVQGKNRSAKWKHVWPGLAFLTCPLR